MSNESWDATFGVRRLCICPSDFLQARGEGGGHGDVTMFQAFKVFMIPNNIEYPSLKTLPLLAQKASFIWGATKPYPWRHFQPHNIVSQASAYSDSFSSRVLHLLIQVGEPVSWLAKAVFVAIPPRLALPPLMTWEPSLPPALLRSATATPTWMAETTKVSQCVML